MKGPALAMSCVLVMLLAGNLCLADQDPSSNSRMTLVVLEGVDGGSLSGQISHAFQHGISPLTGDLNIRVSDGGGNVPFVPASVIHLTATPIVGAFGSTYIEPGSFQIFNARWAAEGLNLSGDRPVPGFSMLLAGVSEDHRFVGGQPGLGALFLFRRDPGTGQDVAVDTPLEADRFLLDGFFRTQGQVEPVGGFLSMIGSFQVRDIQL